LPSSPRPTRRTGTSPASPERYAALFGENIDELLAAGLDVADLGELLDLYNDEEGSGESPASGDSSSSGTRRSRQASKARTASN
jgi:hypothetical protein